MGIEKTIEHSGVVKHLENNSVVVSIIKNSGCISCQAKKSCNVSEVEEKEVSVKVKDESYSVGEKVMVYYNQSLGYRALLLGYVLPFLLVLTVLASLIIYGINEGLAGLFSLSILVPYYLILYFTRKQHLKTFSFSIKKI